MDEVKDEVEVKDVDVKDVEVTFRDGLLNGVSRALTWLTHVRQPVLAVSASTYPEVKKERQLRQKSSAVSSCTRTWQNHTKVSGDED